jgi:hypothetical protein
MNAKWGRLRGSLFLAEAGPSSHPENVGRHRFENRIGRSEVTSGVASIARQRHQRAAARLPTFPETPPKREVSVTTAVEA